jgi:hypothetical protein
VTVETSFDSLGLSVCTVLQLRSEWSPIVRSCVVLNTQDNTPNIVVTFISDVILLVIMLVGLLVLRHESGVTFPLGELLWNQVGSGRSHLAEDLLSY